MKKTQITSRGLFLFLTLMLGVTLLSSFIDYQHTLSTGDHGLLLYGAEATLRGERPFHDYHYFYGPLMPYYYATFLKIFGNNIVSVLIGQQFLILLSGLLIFASLSLFLSPFAAMAGSLWFWVFNKDFFYTYNHQSVVLCALFVCFCVFQYLKSKKEKSLYFGLMASFMAGLIKLNFGAALILCLLSSTLLINITEKRSIKKSFYLWALLITPLLILISNWLFIIGLPFHIIKQCYQYFGNDAVAKTYPGLMTAITYLGGITYKAIIKSWLSEFILVVIAIIGTANIYQYKKGQMSSFGLKPFLLILCIPFLFYVINLHEFLISGIYFRTFYSYPFVIMLFFLAIGLFAEKTPRFLQNTLIVLIIGISLCQFYRLKTEMAGYRTPSFYLPVEKAKIFSSNRFPWTQTVMHTTLFFQENLKKDELFLALPYDPLYYYLVDRKSPTRQLAFFEFLNIPESQEREVIADLEKNQVNWIVISNRAVTEEIGLGVFGVTHCKILAQYIEDHFEAVDNFGIWTTKPSWAWFHGTRILKRKSTL